MKVECPQCGTHVEKPLEGDPVCPNCGYGAAGGAAASAAAPQAGAPGPEAGGAGSAPGVHPAAWAGGQAAPPPQRQGLAITSLVLGIVGCCIIPVLPSIAAIITGAISLKKIKEEPGTYGGHGMAMTGLILGIVGLILGIILVVFYAAIFAIVLDCEENPDQDICRDLEDDGSPGTAEIKAGESLTSAMPFLAALPAARWHRPRAV